MNRLLLEAHLAAPEIEPFAGGRVAIYTAPRPGREGPNEDGALVARLGAAAGVLAVADGAGGESAGARAAALALAALADGLERAARGECTLREAVLSGFDTGNEAVMGLGVGAATTLAAVAFDGDRVRAFHVGDSLVLVVGQRGKRKLETIAHSPVGYAVEAGVLDEQEALHHEERHLVSNLVGSQGMRVEMSQELRLAPRDTLLLASDGLSDNLHLDELTELIRKGPLDDVAGRLAKLAATRMASPRETQPSKPDDLTYLLFRRT